MPKLLRPTEDMWQPADFLPDFAADDGLETLNALREEAQAIPDDVINVLVGDTITEEALPTYASWLAALEGVGEMASPGSPWAAWNRAWCAEEKRHGDVLACYLRLSGRVHMREVEVTVHHLVQDGMDIQTGTDPYRFFVYTSFQELATNRSHRNVGHMAKAAGADCLYKMSRVIAGDEGWHARAYRLFVQKFIEVDTNEAVLAIADMMRRKILMPAMNLRERGAEQGATFATFERIAQRTGVYTGSDYVEILEHLLKEWDIEGLKHLSPEAGEARDYLCQLPVRYRRTLERKRPTPEAAGNERFRWMI